MTVKRTTALKLGIAWFIIISFLFFLPGSAFPKTNIFSKIQFDKWIHFGFFFLLTWLWSKGLNTEKSIDLFILFLAASVYGFNVEVLQDQYVKYRAFDGGDVLADIAGALAGIIIGEIAFVKKVNPRRNGGRNQN